MFCLNYYPSQKYIEDADELMIPYSRGDRALQDFIKKYQQKTIIIKLILVDLTDIDIQLLKGLCNKYHNVKVIIHGKDKVTLMQQNQIPFFIAHGVSTVDELYDFISYHPTDIYIGNELGFSLDKVSNLLHKNNIKVRVIPNMCQANGFNLPVIKTFFIRPEDISIYSTFVDVFEIVADKNYQQTLFKVYKQEKWFGKLSDLIVGFSDDLDNKYIIDSFGPIRSKCGKRCLLTPGSCNICDRLIETAATLKDNKIVISRQKKTN